MKMYIKIYEKMFMQIWLLVLSILIISAGIALLTDLKNYRCVLTKGYGTGHDWYIDEAGKAYVHVYTNCETEFRYVRAFHSFECSSAKQVRRDKGYELKDYTIYLDIYQEKDGKSVLLETVQASSYSEKFYDIKYGFSIKIKPRLENVKIKFPAWRIYVPILLFMLSVPIAALSVYNICVRIVSLRRQKIESETPIDGV